MILTNTSIFEALDDGRLIIDPEPTPRLQQPGGPESPFGTTSVDLRLGKYLSIPRHTSHIVIDLRLPGNVADTLSALSNAFEMNEHDGYRLEPRKFILGQTMEAVRLRLPQEFEWPASGKPVLAARVEGKSSRARFGLLIHFTAPTIHAGWAGPITLEMMCLGETPIMLYPGLPICQLIIEQADGVPSESESQFQEQSTPPGQR